MKFLQVLVASCVLLLEVQAIFGPDFTTSSAGFHRKRSGNLGHTDGYKLPGNARPIKYDLTLDVSMADREQSMTAEVVITLDVDDTNGNGTYSLELNSDISFANMNNDTFVWNGHTNCNMDMSALERLKIDCPKPINGTNQTLKIVYAPRFSTSDMNGAYTVHYDESGRGKWMVATQFEQGYARSIMPCLDEPEYKAPIQLTLKTDISKYNYSDWIANTKEVSRTVKNKIVTSVFAPTPNMSTYLLAFVITQDFKNFKNTSLKSDYEFAVFARPTTEKYLSIALENGPELIDLMSNLTDIPYASLGNPKMTVAAIPEFAAGGMENWGLITVREQLLVDEGPKRTTNRDKQFLIEVLAHEIAHQWFGDYVTLDWWSDAWLNEGFAQYFQYYLTDAISEEFQMAKQIVVKEQQAALKADALASSVALSNNASDVTTKEDFTAEFVEFGGISYSKGASILNMLHYAMGPVYFDLAIGGYLTRHAYGNATSATFIESFENALPLGNKMNLTATLPSWIYQPGYPILDVAVSKSREVTIKATKYSSSWNESAENGTWWIPLSYATADTGFDTVSIDWINPEKVADVSITLWNINEPWIVFNVQAAGFFRVKYDTTLWNRIVALLSNATTLSTVHVLNRAQLLDDAFSIAKSYQGDEETVKEYYLRAFDLADYLQHETEYAPWYTFFVEMQFLMERLQDEDTLSGLKDKILKVVSPQLVIPSNDGDNVTHTEVLRRNMLLAWACRVGHEKCVEWAQKEFENYVRNASSIDSNYRDVIVCTNLRYTKQAQQDFQRVYDILVKSSTLPMEQKDLIKALSCLQDELMINKTLQTTVNFVSAPYPRMFFDTLLTNVISDGTDKVLTALKFLMVYDYSIKQYWWPVEDRATALRKAASKIFTQSGMDLLKRYIREQQQDVDRADMIEMAQAGLKVASQNMEWLSKNGDLLKSVILYNGGSPPTTTEAPTGGATNNKLNTLMTIVACLLTFYAFWDRVA